MLIFPSYFVGPPKGYEIEQSLRFDGSSKLSRTPSSAGSTTTWTLSYWIKIGDVTAEQAILSANPSAGGYTATWFSSGATSRLKLNQYNHPTNVYSKCPTPKYRDPSAWFHVVVVFDSTNATADDRVRFYVNGARQTDFSDDGSSVGGTTNPSQNQASGVNHNAIHYIGSQYDGTYAFTKSYLAEMHLLDGTAVTDALDFGKYDANGVWIPVEYTGSHGTNGFYLKFDPTATNGIGHDHSGNGNNWTASGFNTSGIGTDVMSDTPTKNWATLNAIDKASAHTLSEGNLKITQGSTTDNNTASTIAVSSGKWYFEVEITNHAGSTSYDIGVGKDLSRNTVLGNNATSYAYSSSGNKRTNSTNSSYGSSFTTGDIVSAAFDADNGTLTFYKNGVSQGQAFTGLTDGPYHFLAGTFVSGDVRTVNFGQRELANPPGTIGATDYFNTITYTANNQSSLSVSGVGFQPDMVWLKTTSRNEHHYIYDSVRGAGDRISPSQQIAEVTGDNTFTSFDSDGFTLGADGAGIANYQTDSMVAWCWKAGGTASSNTDGSITSTVSANNDAGFSIVNYSGSNGDGSVGHGLNAAPSVIIFKRLNNTTSWPVYHSALGASHMLQLNETSGKASTGGGAFGSTPTAPTNSVFSVGNNGGTNYGEMIAYCWAEKTGVSKFGSYTGNGSSTEGPVITCGFRPAMVIIKWYESVNSAESWQLYDNKRAGNPTNTILQPDSNADNESPSDRYIQFTEDGFQLRSSGQQINRSGAKYVFMAFAGTFTADETYKSPNTATLPAPTIKDGSKYFDSVLFNAGTTTVTGVGHQPDFLWAKNRTQSYNHRLIDVVRGVKNDLYSNNVSDEQTNQSDSLLTFTTDGFTHGKFGSADADNFVAWSWKAGGSVSAGNNTDGTITSTVSASPTSGFSIVGWDGTGANGTVGHGLNAAPSVVIVKNRDDNTKGWPVQFKDLGNNYLELNNSSNTFTGSTYFQNTAPTSTVFSVGSIGSTNASGDKMIAYCFAEVDGFFKAGTYTGNNGDQFIHCGFSPALIVIKSSSHSSNRWEVFDSTINSYNPASERLSWSRTDISTSYSTPDFLSNGFNLKGAAGHTNDSGYTYIWMAWAENPFGGDGASPATAR